MVKLDKFYKILEMDLENPKDREKITGLYEALDHDIKVMTECQKEIKAYLLKYMDGKHVQREANGNRTWIAVDRDALRPDVKKVDAHCKKIGIDPAELKMVVHSHYFQLGK